MYIRYCLLVSAYRIYSSIIACTWPGDCNVNPLQPHHRQGRMGDLPSQQGRSARALEAGSEEILYTHRPGMYQKQVKNILCYVEDM